MIQKIDDKTWIENAVIVKQFIDEIPGYNQLCQEAAYILEIAIEAENIEYSSVTHRAKTLKSFLEKITRKQYNNPFKEITDFAGVRLVFLYNSDFERIEKLVYANFNVIEKVDKLNDKGVDKFGYGAIHYIIQLSRKHSGARYDNLKKLKCEIQVRTVLQDAWSIIDHHLIYKNESAVPKQLRRKLNSLAGLFETADDQFNQLKKERQEYILSVSESRDKPEQFLNEDLNIDSFKQYLEWKFPNLKVEAFRGQLDIVFNGIKQTTNFKKLVDIDKIIDQNSEKYKKIEPKFQNEANASSSSIVAILSIAITNQKLKNHHTMPSDWKERFI